MRRLDLASRVRLALLELTPRQRRALAGAGFRSVSALRKLAQTADGARLVAAVLARYTDALDRAAARDDEERIVEARRRVQAIARRPPRELTWKELAGLGLLLAAANVVGGLVLWNQFAGADVRAHVVRCKAGPGGKGESCVGLDPQGHLVAVPYTRDSDIGHDVPFVHGPLFDTASGLSGTLWAWPGIAGDAVAVVLLGRLLYFRRIERQYTD